jgi:hexokinase
MATNPYPQIPVDKMGTPMQEFVIHASVKAAYGKEDASASSVITMTPDTTALEVAALGTAAVVRWVRVADTQASVISGAGGNFAYVVPANDVRKFAVPIEVMYQAPSSMVGANIQNGLYRRVAIKSVGVGSVLVSEF